MAAEGGGLSMMVGGVSTGAPSADGGVSTGAPA